MFNLLIHLNWPHKKNNKSKNCSSATTYWKQHEIISLPSPSGLRSVVYGIFIMCYKCTSHPHVEVLRQSLGINTNFGTLIPNQYFWRLVLRSVVHERKVLLDRCAFSSLFVSLNSFVISVSEKYSLPGIWYFPCQVSAPLLFNIISGNLFWAH